MTVVTHSNIRRFFSITSHHFFFQKVDGWRLRYVTVISNLGLYQTITDASFARSLKIQYLI